MSADKDTRIKQLEAENEELKARTKVLHMACEDYQVSIDEKNRKLAEQQALILHYRKEYLEECTDGETDCVTPLDVVLYAGTEELTALLIKEREEGRKEAVPEDTARLDYLISHDAFVVKRKADSGAITYQLWTQDEDEVHHVLHEESIFLRSPREAIDAAMLAAALKPPGE